MDLDPARCYRAVAARDARFDGRFFTGVTTTGVYCRPVCPARTPKPTSCAFFPTAAAAREAGFRPCLRCRPEASPGTPAWAGTSATVSRALRLIDEGALDDAGVETLAARLGVGGRHLRRLFLEHVGATPVAVAQTRRLHFAKKLLDETDLSMVDVAFGAGYGSVRRFNAAFLEAYGRRPSELRRRGGHGANGVVGRSSAAGEPAALTLRLAYRPPFDWDAALAFLGPRAIPGVESVREGVYRRVAPAPAGDRSAVSADPPAFVEISHAPDRRCLLLRAPVSLSREIRDLAERARRLFDLGADPEPIARHLRADPVLRRSLARRPGLRVPGAWDRFETAVRAILGQQVSVAGATTLAGRLVAAFDGRFPSAEELAEAKVVRIGMPGTRAAALRAFARAVADGEPLLDASAPFEEVTERIAALPGLGPWTAQVIAMRALSQPDAFPASDLGVLQALGGRKGKATAREARERAEAWRPWRAYATAHLWAEAAARRATATRGARKRPAARSPR